MRQNLKLLTLLTVTMISSTAAIIPVCCTPIDMGTYDYFDPDYYRQELSLTDADVITDEALYADYISNGKAAGLQPFIEADLTTVQRVNYYNKLAVSDIFPGSQTLATQSRIALYDYQPIVMYNNDQTLNLLNYIAFTEYTSVGGYYTTCYNGNDIILTFDDGSLDKDALINNVVAKYSVGIKGDTDYQKACSLLSYLHSHIDYDYTLNVNDSTMTTMATDKGVCRNIATIYRICLNNAGIPTRAVFSTDHEWCESYIDGEWVEEDPTWGCIGVMPTESHQRIYTMYQ